MQKLWALRYVFALLLGFGLAVAFAYQATVSYPYVVVAALAGLFAWGALRQHRQKKRDERNGWGFGGAGFGLWRYKEKAPEGWRYLEFNDLEDPRESPAVIGIPSEQGWARLPAWTHGRRDEILERIRARAFDLKVIIEEKEPNNKSPDRTSPSGVGQL